MCLIIIPIIPSEYAVCRISLFQFTHIASLMPSESKIRLIIRDDFGIRISGVAYSASKNFVDSIPLLFSRTQVLNPLNVGNLDSLKQPRLCGMSLIS